jgi:hypothetical protein
MTSYVIKDRMSGLYLSILHYRDPRPLEDATFFSDRSIAEAYCDDGEEDVVEVEVVAKVKEVNKCL